MLKKIIHYTLPFIVLVGSLLVAFGLTSINGATIIVNRSINYGNFTWNYKWIDFKLYLQNIENALNINSINGIIPNQPELPTTPADADILGWVKFLASMLLQYIANWMIYAFNWIILAPIKIILYPINIILSILGLNTTNTSYLSLITSLYNWQLPYIPYF